MLNFLNKLVLVAKGLVLFAIIFALLPIGIIGWRLNNNLTVFERAATSSADAAQVTANTYSEVGYATIDTLDNHVAPAIDRIAYDINKTNIELRKQIKPTSDSVNTVLKNTGVAIASNSDALLYNQNLIADDVHTTLVTVNKTIESANGILTGPEIEQVLTDLAASGHHVRVIVEDPELAASIKELSSSLVSTAKNVDKTTFEIAGATTTINKKINETLYPPPVKGFWKKFGRALKIGVGWLATGAQAGYYLVRIGT